MTSNQIHAKIRHKIKKGVHKVNENILKYLIDSYNKLAFTHDYIFGYEQNGIAGEKFIKYLSKLIKQTV